MRAHSVICQHIAVLVVPSPLPAPAPMQDAKTGKVRDTGVRFADIAGMDNLVIEMKEVVKLLLKDPAYVKVLFYVSSSGMPV